MTWPEAFVEVANVIGAYTLWGIAIWHMATYLKFMNTDGELK